MKKLILITAVALYVCSCSWENEELLFPETEICDTLDVSFALDVVPILTNNCFACHSNVNAPDFTFGFSLEDYEDVRAASTQIVGAIKHDEGFSPMPRGADQLDSCQIGIVEAWVNQGSLNN